MKTPTKHYLLCAAAGVAASLIGLSSAWTSGYETAQKSAYNQTLRGLLSLARSTDQVVFAKLVTEFGANIGRRSDFLQYSLEHPGTYHAPAPPADQDVYDKTLADLRKKYPKPADLKH